MFPMRDQGSFLLRGSLDPPVLPTPMPNATSSRFLLDTAAYIADRKNGTFAETTTRTNQAVGVSFWLAEPPAVSHLCIHCPGMKVSDFLDEPLVVCSGKDMAVIRVAYAYGARPVESVQDMGAIDIDYLVYRVLNGNPSLQVLPNPKPLYFEPNEIGFLPSDGGDDFFLAVVRPRRVLLQYDLHIFSSKTNRWTTRLALLEPPSPKHKTEYLHHQTDVVIAVGGSLLGWVDLWRGIMLCDVLDTAPVLHYIQFPRPMDGNIGRYYLETPAQAVRDVSCSNGFIKLIEIEEETNGLAPADGRPRNGWTAVSWKTKAHWKIWTKNHEAYVDASSILHVLRQKYPQISAPEAPAVVGPLWSMCDDDAFYLMSKANLKDQYGIAVTVNMMKNTVEDVTSFPAERLVFFKHAYHSFALSRPVNMTLDGCKANSQIQEMEDSRMDPKNTMVLVEGLDPCVTENQLKDILEMFGEVYYLKLHMNERYGIIRFASRSCAEEAIKSLNGAQIGSHSVRLSWRLDSLNKPRTRRRFSERSRSGANYHPYAEHYGSHCNTAAQVNNPYASLVATATHCGTCGSSHLLQHQVLQPPVAGNFSNQIPEKNAGVARSPPWEKEARPHWPGTPKDAAAPEVINSTQPTKTARHPPTVPADKAAIPGARFRVPVAQIDAWVRQLKPGRKANRARPIASSLAAPAGEKDTLSQLQEDDEFDAEKHFMEKSQMYKYVWQMVLTLEKECLLSFKGAFLKIDDTKASILNTEIKKLHAQELKNLLW